MIERIDSIVEEILLVEEECATLIAKANEKASAISLSTASKIEEIKKNATEKDKLTATENIKKAELEGLKKAERLQNENEQASDAIIASAREKIDECVDEILRAVTQIR